MKVTHRVGVELIQNQNDLQPVLKPETERNAITESYGSKAADDIKKLGATQSDEIDLVTVCSANESIYPKITKLKLYECTCNVNPDRYPYHTK